jgi:hypothetical protein
LHYFNSTLVSGTDVVTGSSSGGESVTSASGGSSTPTSSDGGGETVASDSGGSTTPTSENGGAHSHNVSDHTHIVTIPAHNHTLTYGIFADTHYPQGISVAINSINVTTALGGPWAPYDGSAEIEVDITDYLVNASGGLHQSHRVSLSCASGVGEVEAEVSILETVQAIAIT